MKRQIWISSPSVYPIIERADGTYVVDLRIGHFRELNSPYEVISFKCYRGRELAAAVGIHVCQDCGTSFMAPGVPIGIRCVRCGSLIDKTHKSDDVIKQEDDGVIQSVVLEMEA